MAPRKRSHRLIEFRSTHAKLVARPFDLRAPSAKESITCTFRRHVSRANHAEIAQERSKLLEDRSRLARQSSIGVSCCVVMGFHVLAQSQYDKLLAAFRQAPGNASYASKQSGVARALAKRVYLHGYDYPARGVKFDPIIAVLEREKNEARAQAMSAAAKKAEEDERLKIEARDAAIKARADQGALLVGTGAVQASFTITLNGLGPLMQRLVASLANTQVDQLPIATRLRILRDYVRAVGILQQSTRDHQSAVRTHFGEPEAYIGIVDETTTPAEMIAEIEKAKQDADRYAQSHGLRLVHDADKPAANAG